MSEEHGHTGVPLSPSEALGGGYVLRDDTGVARPVQESAPYPPRLTERQRRRRLHSRSRDSQRKRAVWAAVIGGVYVVVLLVVFLPPVIQNPSIVLRSLPIYLLVAVAVIGIRASRVHRVRRRLGSAEPGSRREDFELDVIVPAMRDGVCPCCGYDLSVVRADGDGLTRCPECGAGWCPGRWAREWPELTPPAWHADRDGVSCWTARDARGRTVGLLMDLPTHGAQAERRAAARWFWLGDLVVLGVPAALAAGSAAVVAVFDPVPSFAGAFRGALVVSAVLFGLLVLPLFVVWRVRAGRRRWKASVVERRLGRSCCPCCGSGLGRAICETDGCVLCDVCGSAWRPNGANPATLTA